MAIAPADVIQETRHAIHTWPPLQRACIRASLGLAKAVAAPRGDHSGLPARSVAL